MGCGGLFYKLEIYHYSIINVWIDCIESSSIELGIVFGRVQWTEPQSGSIFRQYRYQKCQRQPTSILMIGHSFPSQVLQNQENTDASAMDQHI